MDSGWIKVDRGLWQRPYFKGRPDRAGMWLWLLHHAAWRPTKHDVQGETISIERGQLCISVRRFAEECGVTYQTARSFIERMVKDNRLKINATGNTGRSVITICNYSEYQGEAEAANPAPNATTTQQQRIKGRREEDTSKEDAPRPSQNQTIWGAPLAALVALGVPERQARSALGKWRKGHREEAIFAAVAKAERANPSDPIPYVMALLKRDQSDDEYLAAQGIRRVDPETDGGGDPPRRALDRGHTAHPVPGMFGGAAQEVGPVPERDVRARRDAVAMLALRH